MGVVTWYGHRRPAAWQRGAGLGCVHAHYARAHVAGTPDTCLVPPPYSPHTQAIVHPPPSTCHARCSKLPSFMNTMSSSSLKYRALGSFMISSKAQPYGVAQKPSSRTIPGYLEGGGVDGNDFVVQPCSPSAQPWRSPRRETLPSGRPQCSAPNFHRPRPPPLATHTHTHVGPQAEHERGQLLTLPRLRPGLRGPPRRPPPRPGCGSPAAPRPRCRRSSADCAQGSATGC